MLCGDLSECVVFHMVSSLFLHAPTSVPGMTCCLMKRRKRKVEAIRHLTGNWKRRSITPITLTTKMPESLRNLRSERKFCPFMFAVCVGLHPARSVFMTLQIGAPFWNGMFAQVHYFLPFLMDTFPSLCAAPGSLSYWQNMLNHCPTSDPWWCPCLIGTGVESAVLSLADDHFWLTQAGFFFFLFLC